MNDRSSTETGFQARETSIFDCDGFIDHLFGNVPVAIQIAKRASKDIHQNHLGLREALKRSDPEQLHFHAHAMKGVSRLVKCHALADQAQEMDLLAVEQKLQEAENLATALDSSVKTAVEALDDFVSAYSEN